MALDENNAGLYANRAACHFKLGDPGACAADCNKVDATAFFCTPPTAALSACLTPRLPCSFSQALSLLMPPCAANALQRLKLHVRRGAALEAIDDFESGVWAGPCRLFFVGFFVDLQIAHRFCVCVRLTSVFVYFLSYS